MYFLCILSRLDPNYIKEMKFNWENFVIVRNKKFHVEIRVFLMACLFDLFLTRLLDLVSKMFGSISFCYNNHEPEQ